MGKELKKISSTEASKYFGTLLKTADEDGELIITKNSNSYHLMTDAAYNELILTQYYGICDGMITKIQMSDTRVKVISADEKADRAGYYRIYDLPLKGAEFNMAADIITVKFDHFKDKDKRDSRERVLATSGSLYIKSTIEELREAFEEEGDALSTELQDIILARKLLSEADKAAGKEIRLDIKL